MNIIKNKNEITEGKIFKKERKYILELIEKAINFANPENSINRNIEFKNEKLYIFNESFNIRNRNVYVIGFGKAALGMAEGIKKILNKKVKRYILISPEKYTGNEFEYYRSSHPYPNENSVKGTKRVISLIQNTKKDDHVIFLISGGGSSSLVLPEDGITLRQKIEISKKLIESGADIQEINTVRKFLSGVKGGKLAKLCKAQIINLIISDVVDDRIDMISSGPTVENNTTFEEFKEVVNKYRIFEGFPELKKFLKIKSKERILLNNINNFIILKNIDVLKEIKRISEFKTFIISSRIRGSPNNAGIFLSAIAEDVYFNNIPVRKPVILISGGETEVNISGKKGKGGANQELCLYFILNISPKMKFVFSSIDTDGKDGSSNYAGAIVDNYTIGLTGKKKILYSLELHNAEKTLKSSKDLIFTGLTGTNVNDIQLIYIF